VRRTDQGEPYEGEDVEEIVRLMRRYHSAYYIKADRPPAPLFVGSGFTDDLFPVDEALRFANRTRKRYPRAPVSLLLGDFGHQRASNKPAERERLLESVHAWFDHHLRGRGQAPREGVTAFAQTCPRSAPPRRPFRARNFVRLARGELRHRWAEAQLLSSTGGDPAAGAALDPAAGGGNGCVEVDATAAPGTAGYALPVDERRRLTLIGAPTVTAALSIDGARPQDTQIAARLWAVEPDAGTRRLVARALYRPAGEGRATWQLHPAAWRFEPGHAIELELLGSDAPYARPSNGSFETEVKRLKLRLPVRQRPDCEAVRRLGPPPLLRGHRPAPGVSPRARFAGCRR
jgi:predicted acyl esterase